MAQTTAGRAFVFGRDGERIAYGVPGREVGVWRISRPTGYQVLTGSVPDTAGVWQQDLSPDGRWAVWTPSRAASRTGLELFDLDGGRTPLFVETAQAVRAGFHPVHPKLFVAGREGLRFHALPAMDAGGEMRLGPAEPVALPDRFEPFTASFSADGRRAAVSSTAGELIVLDLDRPGNFKVMEGGLAKGTYPGPASRTGSGSLAMSPDGRWVVVGRSMDSTKPAVWDAQSGKLVQRLTNATSHAVFSPDGSRLAIVSAGSCALWLVDGWRQAWQRPRAAMLVQAGAAAFSPDGALVAWTPTVNEIELADASTGERVAVFGDANLVNITGLRFSTDGRTLAAPANDGLIHVWDVPVLRRELATLGLDWSPGHGARAATARADERFTPAVLGGIGLGTVALAGLVGLMVLRRHGRLTNEFVRATELAASQARELATERELGALKSRFVAMVSHEFRTPLGITMSAVELLRNHLDQLDTAKRKELFDDIFSSTRQMAGLMEQVLVLGRVEAGRQTFRPAPVDLDALCHQLVDESHSATHRRCPIELHADSLPGEARADEPLLRHIFSNLLSNAVKYSPPGAMVEFRVTRSGGDAAFTVRDRGIGIPEADLPNLFQAFHRAGNVGDTPGTGLGLVIVKRCVDLHGGRIDVNSKPGEGTTITVTLPVYGV